VNRLGLLACVVAITACRSEHEPPEPTQGSAGSVTTPSPPPLPPIDRAALLAGTLPDADPTTEVVNAQCRICHTVDYLTQQRLGEAAWKKTIDKMRKFGATLTDEQAAAMVTYTARYWNPELPPRAFARVALPAGALPLAPAAPAPKSP